MSSGFRVSIPNSVRKTIQNIREISGNHTDDEIYAMLRECSMDPNETAQKLLHQDTFHEVRRKRDRRKENVNNREPADSRWRPGMQGRGVRGGRGSHSSRYTAHDAGGERNLNAGKENGDGGVTSTSPIVQEAEKVTPVLISSMGSGLTNGPTNLGHGSSHGCPSQVSRVSDVSVAGENLVVDISKTSSALPPPADETVDSELSLLTNEKASSEIGNPFIHGQMPSKSQGIERSWSQQIIGPQKVGPSKEWKLKSTNPNVVQASSDIPPLTVEANTQSLPKSSATSSEATTLTLQKKLEDLHFSDGRHVIIPNHLQVPEAERAGLSFGSFDANFGVTTNYTNGLDSDKSSTVSESSQVFEETVAEPSSSNQNASPSGHEGDFPDRPQSPTHMPESLSSGEADISSDIPLVPEYDQSKPEVSSPAGGDQYSMVHTAPNGSGFGLMPPILGAQFPPVEGSEPQPRDATRLPSFVVPQPFDMSTNYYTQYYRPGTDNDGRFSPFVAPGAATKYNGNIAVLSAQNGQSPQESGNSLVLSTTGPTHLPTQPAGVIQSSIPATQQPVPVFRQPSGVHISHYPPNYIPFSQYFSPFYGPPPTIQHFLTNPSFPQQPPTGTIYPSPAVAAATGVKYPLSQYKPGTNTGNSTHIGMSTGYGPYSSAPTGYSPTPVTTANSIGNEDLAATQYKENNIYLAGQQSEGSPFWISARGRDISGLQPSSFYNLTPQGQPMTFAGIYHPLLQQSQTMAGGVEMVGPPPAGVYQQPQRPQINWANNY
ncbi:GBF-interacting protein 1-like isoform X2 [Tasmannia lanceolata]|uniref:GBF-interacting protein 1-like isoform X2 n=1 Tax=Tasmannia lanceolata TaxID=3420 RepID=UPI004062F06A